MDKKQKEIIKILIEKGYKLLNQPYRYVEFTKNEEANRLLNDIENFPHAIVLACIMNRQMEGEKAMLIPYKICKEIGGFEFSRLLKLTPNNLKKIFEEKKLHRFYNKMSEYFYSAIQKIHLDYKNDASNIWKGKLESKIIVKRFNQFDGVGYKIAAMTTNILARDFKIPMKNYTGIDIAPDRHTLRVFKRLGLIPANIFLKDATKLLINRARELHPEYPGVFDFPCWEIGKNWCKENRPNCEECYLNEFCPKETVV